MSDLRNTEYGRFSPVVETCRGGVGGWVRFFRRVWILRHRFYTPDGYWDEVRVHFGRHGPLELAKPGLQLRWSGSFRDRNPGDYPL